MGSQDRLVARNGHFYAVGADGKAGSADDVRVRLFGVNLPRGWLFPENRDEAMSIAGSVAALGFNAVRLIGIDMRSKIDGTGLYQFTNEGYAGIDSRMLGRLALLLDALGKKGLRATLVLRSIYEFDPKRDCYKENGARRCVPDPGLDAGDYRSNNEMPGGSRPLDIFNAEMVALQKRFFKDMLQPLLQYPALALIEINNENSLIPLAAGVPGRLPPLYARELDLLWNKWLSSRYESQQVLLDAWRVVESADDGASLVGEAAWRKAASGNLSVFRRTGLRVKAGRIYQLEVGSGSGNGRSVEFSLHGNQHNSPLTVHRRLPMIKGQDGTLTACFRATGTGDNLTLVLAARNDSGFKPDSVSLVESPGADPASLVSLSAPQDNWHVSRPVLRPGSDCPLSRAVHADYLQFLSDTESEYYAEMTGWLRDEIGVDRPITGSQANYGGLEGQYRLLSTVDYLDFHYYWDHPRIPPGRQDDWRMQNTPMVEDPAGGIVPFMVANHVTGKPLVISELSTNHASRYAIDGYVLTVAYAARQDIDGLYIFNFYRGQQTLGAALQPGRLTHWYAVNGDSRISAVIPALARIFLRPDISPSDTDCGFYVDEKMRQSALLDGFPVRWLYKTLEAKKHDARKLQEFYTEPQCRFLISHSSGKHGKSGLNLPGSESGTGSPVRWHNGPGKKDAYIMVDTEYSWLLAGFLPERVETDDIVYTRQMPAGSYGLVALISLDGLPLASSGELLLVNTGTGYNSNTRVIADREGAISCVAGKAGKCSYPFWSRQAGEFLLLPLASTLNLGTGMQSASLERLDGDGNPAGKVPLMRTEDGFRLVLDGKTDRSPWYHLVLSR